VEGRDAPRVVKIKIYSATISAGYHLGLGTISGWIVTAVPSAWNERKLKRHPAGPRRIDQDRAATSVAELRYGGTAMIIGGAPNVRWREAGGSNPVHGDGPRKAGDGPGGSG
jgi:hypothetical protein